MRWKFVHWVYLKQAEINNMSVNNTTFIFIYNVIYVRATLFDLFGNPQALQEKRIQEFFNFSALWDPNSWISFSWRV